MKLLLIIPGAIGDFIVTLPSVVWLRQKLKPNELEIWAERPNVPLAVSYGQADRALALADTGLNRWPTPEDVIFRLKQFNRVISWHGVSFPEWNEEIRQRVPQVDFLSGFAQGLKLHAMDFRKQQVQALFGAAGAFPLFPHVEISPEATSFAQRYSAVEISDGRPIVLIHPGASSRRKQWGVDRFAQLAIQLTQASNQVLLCEGPLDHEVVDEVLAGIPACRMIAAPRRIQIDDLMHLAAVIQSCRLYVGNDSGISHLAAATGVPTLSLFTITDPVIWAPRGPEVSVLQRPSVDEVIQAAMQVLSRKLGEPGSSAFAVMAPVE